MQLTRHDLQQQSPQRLAELSGVRDFMGMTIKDLIEVHGRQGLTSRDSLQPSSCLQFVAFEDRDGMAGSAAVLQIGLNPADLSEPLAGALESDPAPPPTVAGTHEHVSTNRGRVRRHRLHEVARAYEDRAHASWSGADIVSYWSCVGIRPSMGWGRSLDLLIAMLGLRHGLARARGRLWLTGMCRRSLDAELIDQIISPPDTLLSPQELSLGWTSIRAQWLPADERSGRYRGLVSWLRAFSMLQSVLSELVVRILDHCQRAATALKPALQQASPIESLNSLREMHREDPGNSAKSRASFRAMGLPAPACCGLMHGLRPADRLGKPVSLGDSEKYQPWCQQRSGYPRLCSALAWRFFTGAIHVVRHRTTTPILPFAMVGV